MENAIGGWGSICNCFKGWHVTRIRASTDGAGFEFSNFHAATVKWLSSRFQPIHPSPSAEALINGPYCRSRMHFPLRNSTALREMALHFIQFLHLFQIDVSPDECNEAVDCKRSRSPRPAFVSPMIIYDWNTMQAHRDSVTKSMRLSREACSTAHHCFHHHRRRHHQHHHHRRRHHQHHHHRHRHHHHYVHHPRQLHHRDFHHYCHHQGNMVLIILGADRNFIVSHCFQ